MHKILLIDKDNNRLSILQKQLASPLYDIDITNNTKHALNILKNNNYCIVVFEQSLGKQMITALFSEFNSSTIIIIDEQPTIENAVQAMKRGAHDYLDANKIPALIACVFEAIQHELHKQSNIKGMIGECGAMQQIYHYIHKTAPTDCNVLILGETGTGKELVAKSIHNNSHRKNNILVSVNCAAIPETLIESELFGYEKGAFTGADTNRQGLIEAANKGTLFLDEIGELPLEAQARLLRFIQEGEIRRIGSVTPRKVNVRLIAATHRNLKKLCAENLFREDLFYRINVMQLNLPPLRDREDDILSIANVLLERCCEKFSYPKKQFSEQALDLMMGYTWPGNIRELENIIERAVIISDREHLIIGEDSLSIEAIKKPSLKIITNVSQIPSDDVLQTKSSIPQNIETLETPTENFAGSKNLSLEDYFLSFVLKHQDSMNETELARKLGVSRKCLWERRQRLNIPRKKSLKSAH